MRRAPRVSMADIVSDVRAAGPSRPFGRRVGVYSAAGQLIGLEGDLLELSASAVTPAVAAALLPSASAVLFESCGCGGHDRCRPKWMSPEQLSQLREAGEPRFVAAYGTPTWIDVWTGLAGSVLSVLFVHGDVEWGDALL